MNSLVFRLLCLACLYHYVCGYAFYFASDAYCSVTLAVGQTIMGATVQSGNTRSVVVKRNGVTLSSGAFYTAGETLSVSISSTDVEYAIQVASGDATFSNGACSQTRIADGSGTLTMPSSGTVILNGGSASAEGTVKMTSNFVLNCCSSTAPTKRPTTSPTSAKPTVVPSVVPSLVPSVAPSRAPTELPTISSAPVTHVPTSVGTPTVGPTIKPSVTPSVQPSTFVPSNPPFISPTEAPTEVPSAAPTYLSKTLVTYSVSQILYNITASALDLSVDAKNGLADAVLTSLDHFQAPTDVVLSTFVTYTPPNGLSSAPAVKVVYSITYLLEDTEYATSAALQDALTISVGLISNSNLFLSYLANEAVPLLSAITRSSSDSISVLSVVIEQSVAPTHGPTHVPFESDDKFYNGALADKIVVGVLVGLFCIVATTLLLAYYVKNHAVILSRGNSYLSVPAVVAVSAALVALILVSTWATKMRDNDRQYLGVPNWKTNVFAWHPVLMVAGLFFCQVVAISDWVFFNTKE